MYSSRNRFSYVKGGMKMQLFATALMIVSALTTLTVEGIKKLLDENGATYKPNLLACYVSLVLSICTVVLYVVYTGVPVNNQLIASGIALIFLSFLCSTVGYDKVIQTLKQIGEK